MSLRERVTHWLIHHAARRAPDSLSSRLEEEWFADLESRSNALSRLRFAVGCCWASLVIVNEYPKVKVAAASSAAAPAGVIALADRNIGYFSLRSGTLFLIAGLHAALFYGLMSLAQTHVVAIVAPLQNRPVALPDRPVIRPVIPDPVLKDFAFRPDPDRLTLPPVEEPNAAVADKTAADPGPPQPPVGPPSTHEIVRVQGGPGLGFPDPDQFYPLVARHLGEQGIATVRVCVDVNGRLTSSPTTVQGTGSSRLDAGALALATAANGHYRASTEDGHAVNSCYPFRIRFQIKN